MTTEHFDRAIEYLKQQAKEVEDHRDQSHFPMGSDRNSLIVSNIWKIISEIEEIRSVADRPRLFGEMTASLRGEIESLKSL